MLTITFKLIERKKALARYDELPNEDGTFANGGPKPLFGTLWPRMDVLGAPETFTMTIEANPKKATIAQFAAQNVK